jgi:Trk K+ transport system NAD-binding subunit
MGEVQWPPGAIAVAVTQGREIVTARDDTEIQEGDRIILLTPAASPQTDQRDATMVPQR